jgi:hypothetical protein
MDAVYSFGPTGVGIVACLLALAAHFVASTGRSWLRMRVAERRQLRQSPSGGLSPQAMNFLQVLEDRLQR